MIFTSVSFIIFLAVLFVAYYTVGHFLKDKQWIVLLVASIYFYTFINVRYMIYLAVTIFLTWGATRIIESQDKEKYRRFIMIVCLLINIGILCYVKYTNVFAIRFGYHIDGIIVPLGISFYTFQSIGYCIDVYRGVVESEKNIFKYALYVSFFPHISQGPIAHYEELMPQLMSSHKFDYDRFVRGLERMLLGFFKKILIANNLALIVDRVYENPSDYAGLSLIFATVMYAFQLYADFSGYMDIAIGAAECLGIGLAENFETPYFSRNISEYWRRWHITLGAWFRDYVYYSVLRSSFISKLSRKLRKQGRKKAAKLLTTSIGLFATWLCIGFWHGASLNFIGHGLFHGTFIIMAVVLEEQYKAMRVKLRINEDSKLFIAFQMIRTFMIVNIGYVMFRSPSFMTALRIYKSMVTNLRGVDFQSLVGSYDHAFWICVCFGLVICLVIDIIDTRAKWLDVLHRLPTWGRWLIIYAIGFIVIVYAYDQPASAGSFLYFDF